MIGRGLVLALFLAGCVEDSAPGTPDARLPECSDGIDNDEDGLIDLADWGCESPTDDEELDPTRACNDGVDNDDDGNIDLDDPGCENIVDNDEYNAPDCSDGIDNDGDGVIDFPFEPGCLSELDPDETDPLPAECSDGIDNDGDGLIDYPDDPGCLYAADGDEFGGPWPGCGPSFEIVDITVAGEASGSISAAPDEVQSLSCGGMGAERIYTYSVTSPGPAPTLIISTDHPETTLDTVLYVREICVNPDTELGCDDDGGVLAGTSTLTLENVNPGSYFIIVDSFGPGSLGDFRLTVE